MNLITTNIKTMSSREIADLTGKQHGHVKRDIEKMRDELNLPKLDSSKFTHNNNQYDQYHLNEELTLTLISGYNLKLRNNVIKRWQELEAKQVTAIPQTYAAALLEAGRLAQALEETSAKLIEAQPKAEFFDQVTDSKDAIDMASAAKVLNIKGMGRNKLFQLLRDHKVFQSNNQPYQKHIDAGRFRIIESKFTKPNGDTCINIKTVVYQRGLDYILKLVNRRG
jgi:phage antirepressor YoqD-like protein